MRAFIAASSLMTASRLAGAAIEAPPAVAPFDEAGGSVDAGTAEVAPLPVVAPLGEGELDDESGAAAALAEPVAGFSVEAGSTKAV
jgi:hypothetical protein